MKEIWDIYDENGNLTGRTQERGDAQAPYARCLGEPGRRGPLGRDEP